MILESVPSGEKDDSLYITTPWPGPERIESVASTCLPACQSQSGMIHQYQHHHGVINLGRTYNED